MQFHTLPGMLERNLSFENNAGQPVARTRRLADATGPQPGRAQTPRSCSSCGSSYALDPAAAATNRRRTRAPAPRQSTRAGPAAAHSCGQVSWRCLPPSLRPADRSRRGASFIDLLNVLVSLLENSRVDFAATRAGRPPVAKTRGKLNLESATSSARWCARPSSTTSARWASTT